MATETPGVQTTSPASKPVSAIAAAYRGGLREAASEDSKVKAVVDKMDGKAPDPVAPEKKTEAVEAPKIDAKPDLKGDPDAGLKAATTTDKETNLANLRKAKEEWEGKYKELESKVPKDYDTIKAEREQFKKDRDDLERALEEVNVERSPRFQEKYNKPLTQQIDAIRKTLAMTDANADHFVALVQMPDSRDRHAKLVEALSSLDDVSKGRALTAISSYDQLREARAAELVNPTQTFQEVQREAQQRTQKQREEHEKVIDQTIERAEKAIPWFKPIEGNDAWNQQVEDVKVQARRMWTQNTSPQELAEVTFAGVLAPKLNKALEIARAENEKLNEELAQYREGTPKNSAGKSTSEGGSSAKGEWKKGDGIKAFFAGAQGAK